MILRITLVCLLALFAQGVGAAGRVFYDNFDSYAVGTLPTTNWAKDDFRDLCQVVSSAADGGPGPQSGSRMLRCNWNGTLAWDAPSRFEAAVKSGLSFNNEVFLRWYIRRDASLQGGTGPKIYRTNANGFGALHLDSATTGTTTGEWYNGADSQLNGTYWGGDSAGNTDGWHKLELYFNMVTNGSAKYWVDDVLRWSFTGNAVGAFTQFQLTSNWSGADGCCDHDATNYLYWDSFEVYSDTGTGGIGSMSNGDITQGGAVTAPDITAVSCSPTSVQAPGSSICTATLSGGTPDTYAWAAQSCGTPARCTSVSTGNPGTFSCAFGGACTLCLTATNTGGADTMCASAISVRYVKPSGFGAN